MARKKTKKNSTEKSKRNFIILIYLACLVLIGLLVSQFINKTVLKNTKYEIENHFICSDYCPGPKELYTKKIYKGVKNENDCNKAGGRFYTYIGWGKTSVCLVK